ncbi:MAG TPA: hypothetical protein VFA63_10930, partial [Pseudonocardiaceae bacterium]|nr:hypothetical protein [Pseudonocardiaceae bacterium]
RSVADEDTWAISPSDNEAHLLMHEQRTTGWLVTCCASVPPVDIAQHEQPRHGSISPTGTSRERIRMVKPVVSCRVG